eukprot:6214550-Pleurochrysis_carterae.AAC.5
MQPAANLYSSTVMHSALSRPPSPARRSARYATHDQEVVRRFWAAVAAPRQRTAAARADKNDRRYPGVYDTSTKTMPIIICYNVLYN